MIVPVAPLNIKSGVGWPIAYFGSIIASAKKTIIMNATRVFCLFKFMLSFLFFGFRCEIADMHIKTFRLALLVQIIA